MICSNGEFSFRDQVHWNVFLIFEKHMITLLQSFDRLLRQQAIVDRGLLGLLSQYTRRDALLLLLGDLISQHKNQTPRLSSIDGVHDLALLRSPTFYDCSAPATIWGWTERYRNSCASGSNSASLFMFPASDAGPDLLFVLERNSAVNDGKD